MKRTPDNKLLVIWSSFFFGENYTYLFHAASDPKLVVAIGACAIGGGMFGRTYTNHGGVDQIVPVYVYVPGCPSRRVGNHRRYFTFPEPVRRIVKEKESRCIEPRIASI